MASPFNNREKEIVKLAVPLFKSGDIDDALTLLVILERANEDSIFANLGLTPANCDSLVSNDFALEQAVRKCFEQESLDPLREYSVIALSRLASGADVMKKAWDMEYKGDADKLFVQAVHIMNTDRDRRAYDNFVPIVQSAGSGKSKMVDEAAKCIFTLPFNLRPSHMTSDFPPGNPQIRDLLVGNVNNRSTTVVWLRYLKFLESLFTKVDDKIKRLDIFDSYEALAKHWHGKLSDATYRSELYSDAVENLLEHEKPESVHAAGNAVRNSLIQLLATIDKHSSNCDSAHWSDCLSPDNRKLRPVRLMLSFDECRDLFHTSTLAPETPVPGNERRSAFQLLAIAIGVCASQDLFVVYLSTDLGLIPYSPQVDPRSMQAPIVELPFDTFATVEEDVVKLEQVSEPGHMVQFGRPLFWSRWQAAVASGADDVQRDLFFFAKTKILGLQHPSVNMRDGQLAALGIRLMLEFEPSRESADREAKLVERHMRVAYSVPKHRQYLHGGTPSEPVLAEAAGRIMNEMNNSLAILTDSLKAGLISRGERGELLARLLLTLAHDKCVKFDPKKAHEALYSKPVPLFRFLEALVGPDHMKRILASKPDNVHDGATFKEAFKAAKVNFTHFVKGGDASVITDEIAWMALSRCMAFQCVDGQWMVDLYIPILLWDEPLGRHVVSGIFIQIKNRLKTRPMVDVTKLEFFTHSPAGHPDSTRYNERPYITIVMDLGVQPGSPKGLATENEANPPHPAEATAQILAKSNTQATTPSKLDIDSAPVMVQQAHQVKRTTHPRYAITIVGCSNAVYDVIEEIHKDQYAALLASGDVLDANPRQGDIFARGVLQLKPYWTMRAQSFHWATGEDKKAEEGLCEPFTEGVYITRARSEYEKDSD